MRSLLTILLVFISVESYSQIYGNPSGGYYTLEIKNFAVYKVKLSNGKDTSFAGFIVFKNRIQHIEYMNPWGKKQYFSTKDANELAAYTGQKATIATLHNKDWLFKVIEGKITTYNYDPGETSWRFIQKDSAAIMPYSHKLLGLYLKDNQEAYKNYKRGSLLRTIGSSLTAGGLVMSAVGLGIYATTDEDDVHEENVHPGFPFTFLGVIVAATGIIVRKIGYPKNEEAIEIYNYVPKTK